MSAAQPATRTSRLRGLMVNLVLVAFTALAVVYVAPALFGYERYVITGGSMAGSIEKGSVVFSEQVPTSELAVGDVITYEPPADSGVSTLVTHRILTIEADAAGRTVLRTQGDANPDPDPWTFSLVDETQPVVTQAVPHVGWVMIALADRETRMLLVGLPAAIIALMALVQLINAFRPAARPAPAAPSVPNWGGPVEVLSPAWSAPLTSVDLVTPRQLTAVGPGTQT